MDVLAFLRSRQPSEAQRIVALPTDAEDPPDLTDQFRASGGSWRLRPVQSACLHALRTHGGLLGAVGVGQGKTLVCALAATALDLPGHRVVVMLPPGLVSEFKREYQRYLPHFNVRMPQLVPYSRLSQTENTSMLDRLKPAAIICDEAHMVARRQSARTKRLLKYLEENTDVVFGALSGTLTSRSITDFEHLAKHALGAGSPLPRSWDTLDKWAAVIDVPNPHRPTTPMDVSAAWPLVHWHAPGTPRPHRMQDTRQIVREAFHARMVSTPGVQHTTAPSCDAALAVHGVSTTTPTAVRKALANLEATWALPDGSELYTSLELDRARKQLAQGFYYTWAETPDPGWLEARAWYGAEVREWLKRSKSTGVDTPALVEQALAAADPRCPPALVSAHSALAGYADYRPPPTVTVWLDDWLVQDALERTASGGWLVWYADRAMARRWEDLGGAVVWPQTDPPPGVPTVALSIHAFGQGMNLQRYGTSLVFRPPSSGKRWEQLLGRTHRPGQTRSQVDWYVYRTAVTDRCMQAAVRDARYLQTVTGQAQKLLTAARQCITF